MKNITLTIKGMHCASCEKIISMALSDLAGVKNVKADYKCNKVSVEFDETKINIQKIKEIIESEGYDAQCQ